jgi:hypothetical protein
MRRPCGQSWQRLFCSVQAQVWPSPRAAEEKHPAVARRGAEAPPAVTPGSNPAATNSGAPMDSALNRLNGVGSLPTTRRDTKGYDDGFTACMAMWEGGSTGLTKEEWTRTCNLARIPPPPAYGR